MGLSTSLLLLLSATLSLGSQDPILLLKELPSLREPDSSLATDLSMPELLELPQERPPSTSPTRSSTPAPGAATGTTTREPTTGSLVARLFKMVPWDFWLVLQAQPLLIMPKEILVEDNDILDYTKRLTHDMVL